MGYFKFFLPGMAVIGLTELPYTDLQNKMSGPDKDKLIPIKNACSIDASGADRNRRPIIQVIPSVPPDEELLIRPSAVHSIYPIDEAGAEKIDKEFAKYTGQAMTGPLTGNVVSPGTVRS